MGSSAALHHPLAFLKRFISYSFFFFFFLSLYSTGPDCTRSRRVCLVGWLRDKQWKLVPGEIKTPQPFYPLCVFLFVVRVYVYDGITTPGMQDEAAAAAAQTTAVAWSRAVAC